ncbi:YrhK family protein [Oceanobacillus piezotolerans]|nr:YrhK family protein [Oceanobacillus piezotolerans]
MEIHTYSQPFNKMLVGNRYIVDSEYLTLSKVVKERRRYFALPKVEKTNEYYALEMGKFELFFSRRYRLLSLVNDLTLGLWYVTGSILFLFHSTEKIGNIFFILGGIQLLGRPILKMTHAFFIRRRRERN